MVGGGELLVMNVGDGVVDEVQQTTATSNLWSSTTGASRGDGERWLESTTASIVVGGLKNCEKKWGKLSIDAPERGEKEGELERRGEASPRRNRR
jgi:hypothetical protein